MIQFPSRPRKRLMVAVLLAAASGACRAEAPPPPGLYQVDREFTMRGDTYGPTAVEWSQKTDGQTGNRTVTRRAMPAGTTATEQWPGDGPVRVCLRNAQPPAWLNTPNCGPKNVVQAPNGPQFTADCVSSKTSQESWQRLGDTRWEHRYLLPMTPSGSAVPPAANAALEQAMAKMEDSIRNVPPDQAAMLRQQLARVRQRDAAAAGMATGKVVEHWTLVSDGCPKMP